MSSRVLGCYRGGLSLDTLRSRQPRAAQHRSEMRRKPITDDEVLDTCMYLPLGKSPGPDRIPNKFYRVMSKTIAPHLYGSPKRESPHRGRLPSTT